MMDGPKGTSWVDTHRTPPGEGVKRALAEASIAQSIVLICDPGWEAEALAEIDVRCPFDEPDARAIRLGTLKAEEALRLLRGAAVYGAWAVLEAAQDASPELLDALPSFIAEITAAAQRDDAPRAE